MDSGSEANHPSAEALLAFYGYAVERKTEPPTRPSGLDDSEACLPAGGGVWIHARGPESLTVHVTAETDEAFVRHAALGPGLAAIWTLRRRPVLHGSCVRLPEGAVSFIGPAGRGKSTLAAQLRASGHGFVSDGLTLLAEEAGSWLAHPGPPWFKLDPQSLTALGRDATSLELVHAQTRKRLCPVTAGTGPHPLRRIYVLTDGPELALERLSGASALAAVLDNMYLAPFLPGGVAPLLFRQAAAVARAVPIVQLRRPRRFDAWGDVLVAIESDLARAR